MGALKLSLYASVLSIEGFGLYSLIISIYIFILYSGNLGMNEGLMKLGSLAFGKGDKESILKLRNTAMLYGGGFMIFFSALALLSTVLFPTINPYKEILMLSCALAFSTLQFNLTCTYLRATQQFVRFSLAVFIKSLLIIILAWMLGSKFGFKGLLISESLLILILVIVFSITSKDRFSFEKAHKGKGRLNQLIGNGASFMFSNIMRNIPLSIDRWAIASALGIVALSKYAFVMILYQMAMVALNLVNTILGSQILAEFGKTNNLEKISLKIKKIIILLVVLSFLLSWPIIKTIWIIVELFYPEYVDSNVKLSLYYIYIGVSITIFSSMLDWIFIASSNERSLLKISVYTLVLTALLVSILYLNELSIEYYAFSFMVVRLVSFVISIKISTHVVNKFQFLNN